MPASDLAFSAHKGSARVSPRLGTVWLVAACGTLLAGTAHATGPTALERAQNISVWGVPASDVETMPSGSDGAAGASRPAGRNVVRSVSVEQSRWTESAAGSRNLSVDRPALADAGSRGRSGVEVTGLSYRWGVTSGRNTVDVGLGAGAYRLRSGADGLGAMPYAGTGFSADGRRDAIVPTFSVGMRHSLSDQHRIDVYASGTASLASSAVGEFYTAKVKVEWLATKNSGFGFEQAAANMKFSANSNLMLRVRGGGAMVYYRSKF